ncbi:MAG: YicC family protein [Firmicutes bacterium]|nr:YicC family protein [Bacillota bacterium]
MLKSMTGYGRGEESVNGYRFLIEIKTLNHRYFDLVLRAPKDLWSLEDKIRRMLQEKIHRGRVEIFITLERSRGKGKSVTIDWELAAAYFDSLERLQDSLQLPVKKLTVTELALLPEVLNLENLPVDPEILTPLLEGAMDEAISQLIQQRKEEGERLEADILSRLDKLEEYNTRIRKRVPLCLEEYREKLQVRLEELHAGREYDRQRFFTEVAFFAERCNIEEETVRLDSHLKLFRKAMQKDEAVGRKLDFFMQEMNREVNTIASKSSDLDISHLAVEARSEIEKIREQVQNIE